MGLFGRKKKEPLICAVCGKEAVTLPWNAADGKFCNDCYNNLRKYGYTVDDWFDEPSTRIRHWIEMSESVHEYDRPGEEYSAEERQKIMEELEDDAEEFLRMMDQDSPADNSTYLFLKTRHRRYSHDGIVSIQAEEEYYL